MGSVKLATYIWSPSQPALLIPKRAALETHSHWFSNCPVLHRLLKPCFAIFPPNVQCDRHVRFSPVTRAPTWTRFNHTEEGGSLFIWSFATHIYHMGVETQKSSNNSLHSFYNQDGRVFTARVCKHTVLFCPSMTTGGRTEGGNGFLQHQF
jgi:hypothetical protein